MTTAQFYALPEDERDFQIADWELGRQECSQHGGPLSECSDPEKLWYPQRVVCHASRQASAARALWEMQHEDAPWTNEDFTSWSKHPNAEHPFHRDAGVMITVSAYDLTPDDDFLNGNRYPAPPAED